MSATTSQTAAPWAASAPEPPRQPWSPRRLQRPWFTAILTLLAFLLGPVVWGLILVVVLTRAIRWTPWTCTARAGPWSCSRSWMWSWD